MAIKRQKDLKEGPTLSVKPPNHHRVLIYRTWTVFHLLRQFAQQKRELYGRRFLFSISSCAFSNIFLFLCAHKNYITSLCIATPLDISDQN